MKTLKQLAESWRGQKTMTVNGKTGRIISSVDTEQCADELDDWIAENQPDWVQITENENTWPDPEIRVARYIVIRANVNDTEDINYVLGKQAIAMFRRPAWLVWWRPLTPYDRPPQEDE